MIINEPLIAGDLQRLTARHGRHELLRGQLQTLPFSRARHGSIAATLLGLLDSFITPQELGVLVPGGTGYQTQRNPDTVLTCALGFIAAARALQSTIPMTTGKAPRTLPSKYWTSIRLRTNSPPAPDHWLSHGGRCVWCIDPDARTVRVYIPGQHPRTLGQSEVLTAEGILPALWLPIAEIFG